MTRLSGRPAIVFLLFNPRIASGEGRWCPQELGLSGMHARSRIPAFGLPPKGTSFGAPPKGTSFGAHPGYGEWIVL